KYGAKFLVRGGTFEAVEGKARGRNIVLEFKDHATALACYRSPEYTKAKALRAGAVDIDIIVIEGYDGPQPTGLAGLGFSKKLACHLAAISLDVAFYNLCRTHEALRMTPAMAPGITHRRWSTGDLIEAALAAVPTKPTSTCAQRRCHRGRRRRFRERGFMSLMLFFDEIADRRSMDPVELRLALLKDTPRGQTVRAGGDGDVRLPAFAIGPEPRAGLRRLLQHPAGRRGRSVSGPLERGHPRPQLLGGHRPRHRRAAGQYRGPDRKLHRLRPGAGSHRAHHLQGWRGAAVQLLRLPGPATVGRARDAREAHAHTEFAHGGRPDGPAFGGPGHRPGGTGGYARQATPHAVHPGPGAGRAAGLRFARMLE